LEPVLGGTSVSGEPLQAQISDFWSGDGSDNNWTAPGNFRDANTGTTNAIPSNNNNGTRLVFGAKGALRTTANNPTDKFNVNGITFETVTDTAGTSFSVTGSEIEFKKNGSNDPFITQKSALAHTISAPINMREDLTLGEMGQAWSH